MRSAPTLKIWMTPLSSVAMLEKLALLKIAFCKAPAFSRTSLRRTSVTTFSLPTAASEVAESWFCADISVIRLNLLSCRACAGYESCHRFALAIPDGHKQYFAAKGIPEYVVDIGRSIDFKEIGAAGVRSVQQTGIEEKTQLSKLLRRVCPEIFNNIVLHTATRQIARHLPHHPSQARRGCLCCSGQFWGLAQSYVRGFARQSTAQVPINAVTGKVGPGTFCR